MRPRRQGCGVAVAAARPRVQCRGLVVRLVLHVCTAFGRCTCALHSGVCTARTHCAYVCGADADELCVCAVRVNGARMRREGVTKFLEIGPLRVREWLRWTVCLFADGTAVIMSNACVPRRRIPRA